jgi:AraC-like DNA-binding protein
MEPFELPHRHEDASHLHELEEYLRRTEYFQTVALVFRQLSDANRVRLFWLLCHCEECVVNLAAMMGMSPPALSHHLRQLRESGLIVSRRDGKEVYYKAAESEQAQLLHRMIERTMEISCPEEESKAATGAPHLPPLDAEVYEGGGTSEQIETIRAVHDYLTQHLDSRTTIDELSRMFLMNPSTMKALFKSVYGSSLASHIREHRMQHAAKLLLEGDENVAQVARAVGYESQSKFSTEFHKAFGVLPTEYRKSQKK